MKMSSYELGLKSLVILLEKIEKKPDFMSEHVMRRDAKRTKCGMDEIQAFWKKFFWEIPKSGTMETLLINTTEREAWIAFRILKMHFFWDFREIGKQITLIASLTGLSRKDVSAIIEYIMRRHLRDTFADPRSGKLDSLEITDNRHSELPTEKPEQS